MDVVLFSVVESVHHEMLDIVCPSQVLAFKWFKSVSLTSHQTSRDKLSEMICL